MPLYERKLNSKSDIQFERPSANDFDSIVVNNSPKLDSFKFKSCFEAIDCFLEEMKI